MKRRNPGRVTIACLFASSVLPACAVSDTRPAAPSRDDEVDAAPVGKRDAKPALPKPLDEHDASAGPVDATTSAGLDSAAGDVAVSVSSDARAVDTSPRSDAADGKAPGPVVGNPFAAATAQLIKNGYTKADTPSWRPKEGFLVFKDSPASGGVFYKVVPPSNMVSLFREGGGRCTTALTPDGALYFRSSDGLSRLVGDRVELLAQTFPDGTMMSINDLVVSSKGIVYFSSLKWPDGETGKGRMSLMRANDKKIEVMWDSKDYPELENPNGVAIAPSEDFLYVGIARYANRGSSGIFRFPIRPDGTLDVAAGRAKVWGRVNAPDGIATDSAGNVYAVSGQTIHALRPDGSSFATAKIPGGESATNLGFGGPELKSLYITTNKSLYHLPMNATGTLP